MSSSSSSYAPKPLWWPVDNRDDAIEAKLFPESEQAQSFVAGQKAKRDAAKLRERVNRYGLF